ncbi:MAG: DnaD domain protein [Lachnospiraceae bacterium]|nr:DnaD domain protein [Lachnospiraceae bacterium]
MTRINLYNHNSIDTTSVSNLFIDIYMNDANDAQIKVYLYLLRMLRAGLPTSVTDIADKFNHTEKEVLRAIRYWAEKQLLDLDYDCYQNLVGIHIRELTAAHPAPGSITLSYGPSEMGPIKPVSAEAPAMVTAPAETAPVYSKPAYSADRLKEFKGRDETAQLLFVVESYMKRPLTPSDIKSILFYKDELEFSDDLIDYLIQYCVDRDKKDFKYIDKVAISWKENDITTPGEAAKYSSKYDKNIYAIMNQLGKNNTPTNREMEYILRWTKDYGFPMDIIFEACDRTVMATDKHRFEYAEKILSSWKEKGVHKKDDINRIDRLYQKRREPGKAAYGSNVTVAANRFNRFQHNDYDFNVLEEELLSN